MPFVFKYFWFIDAAFMFANIVMWRRRMLVAVERGRATRAEVDRFVVWLMTSLAPRHMRFSVPSAPPVPRPLQFRHWPFIRALPA